VINCEPTKHSIIDAIQNLYSEEFRQNLISTVNPYGEGGASTRIVKILSTISLEQIVRKTFYDL
jgi:GDP/UDP-N,N'-diacetylbacillosamine 2-epimerase (hydrolysing)